MANVKQRRTGNAGSVVIEAALVLPIFFLLFLGMCEFGWLFLKSQEFGNAARDACRMAIGASAKQENVTKSITKSMEALDPTRYTVKIETVKIETGQMESIGDVANVLVGNPVTVTITVPYTNCSLLGGSWVSGLLYAGKLESSVTMMKEGS
jgi:Flp pilus assembly protein TadG